MNLRRHLAATTLLLLAIPALAKPKPPVAEDKVAREFKAWGYKGARTNSAFTRGPVFLLSLGTTDSLETVWKTYAARIPVENNVPLAMSWDIPGENTLVGANSALGSSYALTLRSAPRDGGTIVYQNGSENFVIEIRAALPEETAKTGIATDIKLIKMRPVKAATPTVASATPKA